MGKIVGNYIFLLWIFICWLPCFGASINMRVLDMDGSLLVQAGAGHPFIIELNMVDVGQMGQSPTIKGMDTFHLKNAGMRITTVNGKTTSKYLYELRIDTPGSYEIGPAELVYNNQKLVSNRVRITVGNEQIEQQQKTGRSKKQQHAPILLRLSTDKQRVVAGQRVTCTLRFYISDPEVSLRQLIEQDSPELIRKHVRGPKKGTELLDGVEYGYAQWEWDIYPQKAGSFVIPAYGADYDRIIERDDFWGGLGRFLGDRIETKRVYSNAVLLDVDALPSFKQEVKAVGRFTALNVSAKPTVAKQGEGIVVAVEVLGDGDPDAILFPGLQGVPDALKYYESSQTEIESSGKKGCSGKRFEYIMQGLKAGTWEIPSQSFDYYDVVQGTFKTLHSVPLTITIMPGANHHSEISPQKNNEKVEQESDIAAIHNGNWYPVQPFKTVPWWLFVALLLLPICFVLYRNFMKLFRRRERVNYRAKRARRAFQYARAQLEQCKKNNNAQRLYSIFTELFADRWQISIATVSISYIEKRLRAVGMNEAQRAEWEKFFLEISERAFGAKEIRKQDDTLLDKAKQWIEILETFL